MAARYRVFLFLLCLSLPAFARQNADAKVASAETEAAPLHESEVTLDVVVTDRAGKPVTGLQQQDFTVLDNKKPQAVVTFKAVQQDVATGEPAAKVILVVDEVNASYQSLAYERAEIKRFLQLNGGKLVQPVSLAFFSDKGTAIQNGSTRDGNALLTAFDENRNGLREVRRSAGYWGAAERYEMSLTTLSSLVERETKGPGRKLLVWISPGWPLLSGPNVLMTKSQQRGIFGSIVKLTTELQRAHVTLYMVDPFGAGASISRQFYYESFVKGVSSDRGVQSGNLALQVLSIQSGGLVLNASNDIASRITRAANDANAYYVLSMKIPPVEHSDEYHSVQVKVNKPGLTVRTRTGYYAQP